ncbi:MAG: FYDLN acid domain-containing protein [Nitrospinota bacterium]|nr:FYDLN acid domain-containing protein [Nitrospinota bacterium]MDH5679001.1 FYDLN acid domain-containing protein [Nitrospinota bacterium]MDH5756233.1 FYDLN acid domain-containing protein [Nitrospinota bacterium]
MTHPKYGQRFTCYQCGVKFFDLNKPKPLCPKCGADQKKAPKKATTRIKPVAPEEFDDSVEDDNVDDDLGDFAISGSTDDRFDPDHDHIRIDDMPEDEL